MEKLNNEVIIESGGGGDVSVMDMAPSLPSNNDDESHC